MILRKANEENLEGMKLTSPREFMKHHVKLEKCPVK